MLHVKNHSLRFQHERKCEVCVSVQTCDMSSGKRAMIFTILSLQTAEQHRSNSEEFSTRYSMIISIEAIEQYMSMSSLMQGINYQSIEPGMRMACLLCNAKNIPTCLSDGLFCIKFCCQLSFAASSALLQTLE